MLHRLTIFLLFTLSCWQEMAAQDLGSLGQQDPVRLSGSLRLGYSYYGAEGRENRRSPYAWYVSGNPTLTLYGVRFPFSFSFRNQQHSIDKPFQRFGVSPYYKWAKLHLGYRNLNWSPYTLGGHTFLGGGMELTPGKFRLSAMYGKLQNVVIQEDTLVFGAELLPVYRRIGYGGKIGYGTERNHVDLILFKAKDDPNTVQKDFLLENGVKPSDNAVLGLNFRFTFFKKLTLEANTAASAFTGNQDASDGILDDIDPKLIQSIKKILDVNLSSRIALAGDVGLNMRFKGGSLGFGYKRVEPLFTSLGTYYLRDDYENLTANGSLFLARRRVSLRGSYGLQRNNLFDIRSYTNIRRIGSLMVSLNPGKVFGLNLQYANYQTEQQDGLLVVNDTLRFAAVSKNWSIMPHLHFKSESLSHNLSLTASHQTLEDLNEFREIPIGNTLLNTFFNYNLRFRENDLSLRFGLNYNTTDFNGNETQRYGGTAGINKQFWEKRITLRLSSTYNLSQFNGEENGNIWNTRLGASLKVKSKHRLDFSAGYIKKNLTLQNAWSEWRGRVSYVFGF